MQILAEKLEGRWNGSGGEGTSIGICLLFSYLNAEHELRLRQFLKSRFPQAPISVSHEIAPIWREYERSVTVVADAFVKPMLRRYVTSVREGLHHLGLDCP